MNIIFQTGEFLNSNDSWFSEFMITIFGTLIGSGVTVWVLYRTIKYDKKKEEQKNLVFQKEKLKYFQSLMNNILIDLSHQIDYYNEFSESLSNNSLKTTPNLKQIKLNNLERTIHKLNIEDYFHSYLKEFGNKKEMIFDFTKIFSILDYFEGNIKYINDSFNTFINYWTTQRVKLRDLNEHTKDEIYLFLNNDEIINRYPNFKIILDQALLTLEKNQINDWSFEFYHKEFTLFLKNQLIDLNLNFPQFQKFIVHLKDVELAFNEIEVERSVTSKNFANWSSEMKNYHTQLIENTKQLLEKNIS